MLVQNLQNKINTKQHRVAVIGLGYVGLPLIAAICKQDITAIGIDVDESKITQLESGKSYIDGVTHNDIKTFVDKGLLTSTSDFSALKTADVILICVPTPLDKNDKPDLSYVIQTTQKIAQNLTNSQLIILESTTYPGTVEEIMQPILDEAASQKGVQYYLAYSPEREDPGNQGYSTSSTPKLVGADTQDVLEVSLNFYNQFIQNVISVPSIKVAEAAKITENIFRSVNIALVNELKVIYANMGIDIWEVIDAAKTKPFGYMPFYPGPGIGGHCIPIDPFYLSWKAQQEGYDTEFIELAGKINQSMTDYIISKLLSTLNLNDLKSLEQKRILILGVAYKKNVKDQRESPAFPLMKKLNTTGAHVDYHDSKISRILPSRMYPEFNDLQSTPLTAETIQSYDAVILVTDHDNVDYNLIGHNASLIIDTRNTFTQKNIPITGTLIKA